MSSACRSPQLIGSSGDTLREAFGRALVEWAPLFEKMVVLDSDVAGGTGVHHFRGAYPERFFQFGIAEQNMVGAAAGFALAGQIPVATTFSVFALRTLEQYRQSIAYPDLNVKLVASHPGLDAGPDGASAQAIEDIAAFRALPNVTVVSPADAEEMRQATRCILRHPGPVYMRTGRSPAPRIFGPEHRFELGKGQILKEGSDVTIAACGVQVARALEAARRLSSDGIACRVINLSTIKPLDVDLVVQSAERTGAIVATEDHNIIGGLGSAIAEALAEHRPTPMEFAGVRDCFGESGEPDALVRRYGLSANHIGACVKRVLQRGGKLPGESS